MQMKNSCLWPLILVTFWIVILSPSPALTTANETDDLLVQLEQKPSTLLQKEVRKKLSSIGSESYVPLMRRFMFDPSLPWDVRTHAYILLGRDRSDKDISNFTSSFNPAQVAASEEGAETFNVLAKWHRQSHPRPNAIDPLIFPGLDMSGVEPALQVLAGKEVHEYLWALYRNGYHFQPASIEILAETDDQPTRQFLNWYVGAAQLDSMQGFLIDQLKSSRPNEYPNHSGRIILAVFTLFLSEVIFDMQDDPPWLDENVTPKSLALQSLAVFFPPDAKIHDRQLVKDLLAEANYAASGKDRGQWQLAIDIMYFLLERHELHPGQGEHILATMARQALIKCGQLKTFAAAEEIGRMSGIPFPDLHPEEKKKIWDITLTTFDAKFLAAVARALLDTEKHDKLAGHLLSMQKQAVNGSLRISRCWSAAVENNNDWALAAGELGLIEAIPSLEKMLYSFNSGETVSALVKMKEHGAPVIARFLRSTRATALSRPSQLEAIQACRDYLSEAEWSSLAAYLRSHKYFSAVMEQAF